MRDQFITFVFQPVLKVLQVLDLSENLLGNEGIQAIREPLIMNSSVLQLILAQTCITCEGVKVHHIIKIIIFTVP